VREAPDLSADADPSYGYVIYYNGAWYGDEGGTSAPTQLWAAIAALTNASPFCQDYASGTPGVYPLALYDATAINSAYIYDDPIPEILRDVTSGNNDYTPSGYTGGLYPAGAGYDLASGLGTPIVAGEDASLAASTYYPGYAAWMCEVTATQLRSAAVTSVSPSSGAAGKAVTVTVHGSGFLPIAGADRIGVYSGSTLLTTLTPSCTTTACTVTLPAEPAQTVDLRASAEDQPYTAATSGDRFTYSSVAAPHVSSISPTRGTSKGGTKVTISGSGFTGVKSVTFGGKAGTGVTVQNSGSLTVLAPSGTEGATVKVVVSTAGGTSNAASYLYADAPRITLKTPVPWRGLRSGGTTVALEGTNFIGVKSVTFGGKPGTHLTVYSTGLLTVVTPSGSGTVSVVINAAGGTSNAVPFVYVGVVPLLGHT
jgi:hypothetical protein